MRGLATNIICSSGCLRPGLSGAGLAFLLQKKFDEESESRRRVVDHDTPVVHRPNCHVGKVGSSRPPQHGNGVHKGGVQRHFLTDVVSLHRHGQRIDRCRYARRHQYVLKLVPLNFRAE